jgi:hypothetical protein
LPIDSGKLYFITCDTVFLGLVEQNEWILHGLKMKGELWSFKYSASCLTIFPAIWNSSFDKLNSLNKIRYYLEVGNLNSCYFQGYDQIFVRKNTKSIKGGSFLGASLVLAVKILLNL